MARKLPYATEGDAEYNSLILIDVRSLGDKTEAWALRQ